MLRVGRIMGMWMWMPGIHVFGSFWIVMAMI
jgi:hypothetical protein